jgi:hypothetical protein
MALPDERFEICYRLDAEARSRILPALRLRLLDCPMGPLQRVQSLYFGAPPAPGAEPRRRLRLRLHETDGRPPRCVVEVKHRVGLRSLACQAIVGLADVRALLARSPIPAPPGARAVLDEARDLLATGELRPTMLVAHDRIAMIGDEASGESDLRVTYDSGLRWRARDLALIPGERTFDGDVLPTGEGLLVVKVARAVPHWLTLLLGRTAAAGRSPGKHALAALACRDSEAEPERAEL